MRFRAFILGISILGTFAFGFVAARMDLLERLLLSPAHGSVHLHVPPVAYGHQKVVYHVNNKGPWHDRNSEAFRLVHVVGNHIRAVEPDDISIEIIFHGNGVDLLRRAKTNPELAAMFGDLRKKGVKFRVCANTLTSNKIPLEALHGTTEQDLVQSAVAEVVRLEREGYSYIRF